MLPIVNNIPPIEGKSSSEKVGTDFCQKFEKDGH
jgi:hypothetical protein